MKGEKGIKIYELDIKQCLINTCKSGRTTHSTVENTEKETTKLFTFETLKEETLGKFPHLVWKQLHNMHFSWKAYNKSNLSFTSSISLALAWLLGLEANSQHAIQAEVSHTTF